MNYLVSVGIQNRIVGVDVNFSEIPCALNDSKLMYDTFKKTLGNTFNEFGSVCLYNANVDEFIGVIRNVKNRLQPEDNLIIYYSGHGEVSPNEELLLFLKDTDRGDKKFKASRIKEVVENIPNHIIVILDCCHSGQGLKLADANNMLESTNITVIAATSAISQAQFNKENSLFTLQFCNVLEIISRDDEEINLSSIQTKMHARGLDMYFSNTRGHNSIILKEKETKFDTLEEFSRGFISRVSNEEFKIKEMLWYAIEDFSESEKLYIINNYHSQSQALRKYEAHWLVRRAIGSLIGNLSESKQKNKIINLFLKSSNWMEQVVGVIAARKLIAETEINSQLVEILKQDKRVDLTWLAHLYLSDNLNEHPDDTVLELAIKSSMGRTEWGIIDIWNRHINYKEPENLFEILKENCNGNLLKPLLIHIFLKEHDNPEYQDLLTTYMNEDIIAITDKLKNCELVKKLYNSQVRGGIKNPKRKWLISAVYGNWRDQMRINYEDYFQNNRASVIKEELRLAANLPLVEMKMSIFQFMETSENDRENYKEAISWGSDDIHPWVRRSALPIVKSQKLIPNDTDKEGILPGILDLIIEARLNNIDTSSFTEEVELYPSEENSIGYYQALIK